MSNEAASIETKLNSQSGVDQMKKIKANILFGKNNSQIKTAYKVSPHSSELTQINPTDVDSIKSSNSVIPKKFTSSSEENVNRWLQKSNPSSQYNAGLAGTGQVDYLRILFPNISKMLFPKFLSS